MVGGKQQKSIVFNYNNGSSENNEYNQFTRGPLLFNTFQAPPNRIQKEQYMNAYNEKSKVN